ncbi:Costunolide synthase [Artemisia annua]|uniref:Costunolide synthase n=1 Tax=Artemisia annua TaxID=35608 RepID=A0A2U1P0S5_ARTAN|nr:Costunolide synthase [Artemisia annua]
MGYLAILSYIASSIILFICWALIRTKTSKNLPPGPPKFPILGNIHQLKSQAPHRVLNNLARIYGPIMHLQFGQVPTVVISTPRLAQEILKTHDISFAYRPPTTASQIFFYNAQNVGWAPYGNYWRQMKKILTLELLSAKKVQSFSYIREEELNRALRGLESSTDTPIYLREVIVEMVNNVVSRATIGDVCKHQKILIESIYAIVKTFSSFNVAAYYPSLQFLNVISGKMAKWQKMQRKLDRILEDILEEHKSRPRSGGNNEDLVDVLLRVKNSGGLDLPITNDTIKAIVLEMLIAGTSSSSMTIEWAMSELMRKPEMMMKVQSEVRSIVKGNTIAEADIQSMHYMKMILKETLRLHGVPILVPRENQEDCNVDGYNIPAKTRILINSWACATDPGSWENPHSFIPERFENSSVNYLGLDFEFIPFGAGRRMCPGISFGMGIVEYALANFLYHFDWKLPHGLEPHEIDMTEVTGISTLPKHQLQFIPISTGRVK